MLGSGLVIALALSVACDSDSDDDDDDSGGGGSTTTTTSTTGTGCDASCEQEGFTCCGDTCVNLANDIDNCGSCSNECTGEHPFCAGNACEDPPCASGTGCASPTFCCDTQCCDAGQLCCVVPGPVSSPAECTAPTAEGSCPLGCLLCACAAPDTPIATPDGERPIADIREGELVYSVHRGEVVAVPVKQINRADVRDDHLMIHVVLAGGASIAISAEHPTADGRTIADLRVGDVLHGQRIAGLSTVRYGLPHTFDILPDSDTAAYFAGGLLMGSTLNFGARRVPAASYVPPR